MGLGKVKPSLHRFLFWKLSAVLCSDKGLLSTLASSAAQRLDALALNLQTSSNEHSPLLPRRRNLFFLCTSLCLLNHLYWVPNVYWALFFVLFLSLNNESQMQSSRPDSYPNACTNQDRKEAGTLEFGSDFCMRQVPCYLSCHCCLMGQH